MTIAEGYPDWQRVTTTTFIPMLTDTRDTGGSTFTTSQLYVANYPTVIISLSGTGTTAYNVTLSWYASLGDVTPLYTEAVGIVGSGPHFVRGITTQAPVLAITYQPVGYAAGDTVTTTVVPTTNTVPDTQLSSPFLVELHSSTVTAGSTLNSNFGATIPGPAILHYRTSGTNWSINVQQLSGTAVWQTRYSWSSSISATSDTLQIACSPRPMRLQIVNSDAADHTYDVTIGSIVH